MNAPIDLDALLASAIVRADGVQVLARDLNWCTREVGRVQSGEAISPYRAAQLARYLDLGRAAEGAAVATALAEQATSTEEAAFWIQWLGGADPVEWNSLQFSLALEQPMEAA